MCTDEHQLVHQFILFYVVVVEVVVEVVIYYLSCTLFLAHQLVYVVKGDIGLLRWTYWCGARIINNTCTHH